MKRRLEEALEHCLAALARGQSTVEECLALHPELAAELEPLLHTARRLQDAYDVDPSPLYEQAARQRFLAVLARRRQARLAARPARLSWRWVPAALGMTALVAFAAWASVLAFGGGGRGGEDRLVLERVEPTSTPAPVETSIPVVINIQEQAARVQAHLEEIRTGAEGGAVEAVAIQQMKEDTAALVESLDQPQALKPEEVSQIGKLFADQEKVLSEVKERVAPQAAGDVDEIIRIAGAGRAKVEKMLSPTASATPSATPTAAPSATPTATPSASPSATPTATPSATPEESPTSTATPAATPSATATLEVPPTEIPQSTLTPEAGEESSPTATPAP